LDSTSEGKQSRCPVCGELADRRSLRRGQWLEAGVAARIALAAPEWKQKEGACFRCVSEALESGGGDGSEFSSEVDGVPGREILRLQSRLPVDPNYAGRGVTVAVIDSDFVLHPEFQKPKPRVETYVDARGAEAREGARPPKPYLGSWHGTMVAGAGFGSGWTTGGRYRGIAPAAKLVLVSVAGANTKIGENETLRGLRWVVANASKHNIRIVNLSVGGDAPMPSKENRLDRLVARAEREGIVVICAAGNRPDRPPVAPASAPEAITVGGVDDGGRFDANLGMYGGSHGPTLDGVAKPDLVAPAVWVPAPMVPGTPQSHEAELLFDLESLPDRLLPSRTQQLHGELRFPAHLYHRGPAALRAAIRERRLSQKYISRHHQHVDGTSFACAIVSAVAAQILEVNPAFTPEQVRACLVETAAPIEGVPPEVQGAGLVQPAAAVAMAQVLAGLDITNPRYRSPLVESDAITYRYYDPTRRLRAVEWCGALAGWRPLAMDRRGPGQFELRQPRPKPGRYAYKFLFPDGGWSSDPRNSERVSDGFGGWNSVVVVEPR
jgi:serine protease AprX